MAKLLDQNALGVNNIKVVEYGICTNIRTVFNADKMRQLAESIQKQGLLSPLIVRKVDDEYHLLGGERRLRSIKKLIETNKDCWSPVTGKWHSAKELYSKIEVKCYVCSETEAIGIALTDNVERENLTEVEKIEACVRFDNAVDDKGNKIFNREEIGSFFRTSMSWVSQTISISKLPKSALNALNSGLINRTACVQLLKTNPDKIDEVIEYAKQVTEREIGKKIQEAMSGVEDASEKLRLAQTDVELSEVRVERAPINKKTEASSLLKQAENKLAKSAVELENARERLSSLSGTSNPKTVTADAISQANESLQTRTGKGRPYSLKQIRALMDDLENKVKAKGNKKKARDFGLLILGYKFIMRMGEWKNIEDILDDVDRVA